MVVQRRTKDGNWPGGLRAKSQHKRTISQQGGSRLFRSECDYTMTDVEAFTNEASIEHNVRGLLELARYDVEHSKVLVER